MDEKPSQPTTIDAYIAGCQPEVQPVLQKIREVIREAAPGAVERISYQMPGFYQNGMLVWFGARRGYIGFYPTGMGVEAFKEDLSGYEMTKGAVHFPLDQPMPYDLIRRIVQFRVEAVKKKPAKSSSSG